LSNQRGHLVVRQISGADRAEDKLADREIPTRARVSHFMNKFRQVGFIDYNGHLEVHSSLLSVVLNEQPNNVERPPQ
jgi:CRP/FNR family cyclic AMP-dependent transcriptional regulator